MSPARVVSLTLMVVGVLMFVGAVLWFWLGYRAGRNDPFSDFNQAPPFGTGLIGLFLAGAGASTYRSE